MSVLPCFHGSTLKLTHIKINEAVLKKVIEWCTYHKADPPATNDDDNDVRKKTTDIDEWDQKFMQVDQEMLFEIILVSQLQDTVTRLPLITVTGRQLP